MQLADAQFLPFFALPFPPIKKHNLLRICRGGATCSHDGHAAAGNHVRADQLLPEQLLDAAGLHFTTTVKPLVLVLRVGAGRRVRVGAGRRVPNGGHAAAGNYVRANKLLDDAGRYLYNLSNLDAAHRATCS